MNRELLEKLASLERRIGALERQERSVPVVAVYTTTAGQSIPHDTLTVVNFGSEVVDTHKAVSTGAAWRFVAPLAGNYHVWAALLFAATAAWAEHERAILYLHKNGLLYSVLDFAVGLDSSAAATTKHVGGGDVVPLAAGDAIQIRVNQNSGDTLALTTVAGYSHISIFRIH